jgi:hypothetical protein
MTEKRFILTELGKKYVFTYNHLADDPDEILFYPYGEELEYVLSVDPRRVWSWQKEEGKDWTIRAGYLDDVEGYYITETLWENTNEYGSSW